MSQVDYESYLLSPEWRERRAERIRFAGGKCEVCCSPERLEVHHRTYERLGAELMTDLLVLCADCHGRFSDKLPRIDDAARSRLAELIAMIEEWEVATSSVRNKGIARWLLGEARKAQQSNDVRRIVEVAACIHAAAFREAA